MTPYEEVLRRSIKVRDRVLDTALLLDGWNGPDSKRIDPGVLRHASSMLLGLLGLDPELPDGAIVPYNDGTALVEWVVTEREWHGVLRFNLDGSADFGESYIESPQADVPFKPDEVSSGFLINYMLERLRHVQRR